MVADESTIFYGAELAKVPVEVVDWLTERYGPAGQKWFVHQKTVYFRDRQDHIMFLWRWT